MSVPDVASEPITPARSQPRSMQRLVAGAAVDSFGTGISAAATILYFVTIVGFTANSVVAAMSAGAIFGVLSPILVGRLADRFGLIRTYCTALALRGVGFVAYALATQYVTFLLLTLPLMALEAATPPLQQSLVAQLFAGDARIRVMSSIRAARNVALGAGTLVAGAALTTHSQPLVAGLLAINGTSFLILACVVYSLRRSATPPAQQQEKNCGSSRPALRNPAFLGLAGLNGLLLLHDSVLFVLLPLWMVLRLGASPLWVSLMLALNTGLTVAMQLGFGRIRRLTTATNPTLFVAAGALVAACLCCLTAERITGSTAIALCAVAVALLTLGENLHSIAAWQVSFELAPDGRRSEYLSAFNSGSGLQRIVGPVLMTGVVLALPTTGWLVLAIVFGAATVGFTTISTASRGNDIHLTASK